MMKNTKSEIERLKTENLNLKNQISTLNKKLKLNEQFKTHFLSNIRNAMINPFVSIKGLSAQIIRNEKHDWKKVIKLAALIHSEAFDLDFQLKNIFCTAELEAGEKQPEICRTNLEEKIRASMESFETLVRKKKLTIDDSIVCKRKVFLTDPDMIERIFQNLIHNAIKFSPIGGLIEVALTIDSYLVMNIKDHGTGIPPSDIESIFDRFYRADSQINSLNTGHGLGLPIVKTLTEMMGGEIEVKSDHGTTEIMVKIPESKMPEESEEGISLDESTTEAYIF